MLKILLLLFKIALVLLVTVVWVVNSFRAFLALVLHSFEIKVILKHSLFVFFVILGGWKRIHQRTVSHREAAGTIGSSCSRWKSCSWPRWSNSCAQWRRGLYSEMCLELDRYSYSHGWELAENFDIREFCFFTLLYMTKLLHPQYLGTCWFWSLRVSKVFQVVLYRRSPVIFVYSPSLLLVCMPVSSENRHIACLL